MRPSLALALLLVALTLGLAPGEPSAQTRADTAGLSPGLGAAPVPVPEPTPEAIRYHRSGNVLWVVGTLWGLLVPALLLFTGLSARIRDVASRLGRGWLLTVVVYAVIFTALTFLLDLPLSYYSGYVRQHAYGLSNQSAGAWWRDQATAFALGIVGAALTLWVPYLLLRKSPRRWWLYTSLVAIPMVVLLLFITPIWIQPLFDDFGPMRDRALEARILALADRAGIEGGRVFEVNKSADTDAINAYVTGFGGSKRIVLWDTLLERMSEREVLFVMGHEMGHYVLRHTYVSIALVSLLLLLSLYVVHRASAALIDRFRHRFGFSRLDDVASFPLLILIVGVVSLLVTPVVNGAGRYFEREADRFGLEITRDNQAAATAFAKLQQENLQVPYPGLLYKLWRATHPPLGERIDFANRYRPWERGEELRYGESFE